jgi:site-specific DNA-adenine methylase
MQKKIHPLFKSHSFLASWIIESFPENYQDYDYIEPYCSANILFNKNIVHSGHIEVLNDPDSKVINIFRTLRDDSVKFISKLKKVKCCENTFQDILTKVTHDEFDELLLRQMSRAGAKKIFKHPKHWNKLIQQLTIIAERIKDVYIFDKSPLQIIQAFDDINTLIYINAPDITQEEAENHAKLANYLYQSRGKVIISAYSNAFYKRHYREEDGWRFIRKKTSQGLQHLILNY